MAPYLTLGLAVGLIAALLLAERLWPALAQRVEWLNNSAAFGLTSLGHLLLSVFPAVLVTQLINAAGGGLINLTAAPLALGALVYLVAMDLAEYLFHRAQHAWPWLWAMHSLHHSDRSLGVLTTQRHFWLDPLMKSLSIWPIVALLFRADPAIVAVYASAGLYHYLVHANLRLGFGRFSWLLNSPQYHRLHHSNNPDHYNANYASLLPIFDVLSGAYRRPRPDEFPASGLATTARSPLDMVIWPARRMAREVRTP
jgi:sterol desaturase/sphingolipid hydroxylase (fatty acid hydroxylase superfamily)